jgi:exonuclease SbcD
MVRFAHVSDIHVGGVTEKTLRKKEEEAVSFFVQKCLQNSVEFVIISGDLFDTNLPLMSEAIMITRNLRILRDSGVRIYAVYGSHDYAPTHESLIELLAADGLIHVIHGGVEDKSGVWLNGVHGLAGAKEISFYKQAEKLVSHKKNNSVFAFHTGIYETNMIPKEQSITLSSLPLGYAYYAGGHLHRKIELRTSEGAPVNYPGPLFLGYGAADLENYLKGEMTGFYIVDLEGEGVHYEYVPVRTIKGEFLECYADNKTSLEVSNEIRMKLSNAVQSLAPGSLVLLKVSGKLTSGTRASVAVAIEKLRRQFKDYEVKVNDRQLSEPDDLEIESGQQFEERALEKMAEAFPVHVGSDFVSGLIDVLSEERQEGMTVTDYRKKLLNGGVAALRAVLGEKLGVQD